MTITTPPPRTRPARTQPVRTQPVRTQPARRPVPQENAGQPLDRGRSRSAASQRAYARKAQRQPGRSGERAAPTARRTPFVLVVMALLAVGLVTSLWLSTAAAADSYRLEQARLEARELAERSAQLRQDVAEMQTAPSLDRRARDLGMVPSGEAARIVVHPDGTVTVVGTPEPAAAPAPVTPPAPATQPDPAAGQPQQSADVPPADTEAAGAAAGADPSAGGG